MNANVDFNARRKNLGLPVNVLVKRSGVPRPTVFRILRGKAETVRFGNVQKVADVLGMGFGVPAVEPEVLREREARRKARLLARLTQGTMALESQAVPGDVLASLEEATIKRLLADKGKKLWSE